MTVETQNEFSTYLAENESFFGLTLEHSLHYGKEWFTPRYQHAEAKCICFEMPDSPGGFAHLSGVLPGLMSGFDLGYWKGGTVLYQDYDVWNHQNNVEGWKMIERIRAGYGELRPFSEATANVFRDDDLSILPAFLLAALIYGWNAYYIPQDRGSFTFISHDGYWTISTETDRDYDELQKKLSYYEADHWILKQRLLTSKT